MEKKGDETEWKIPSEIIKLYEKFRNDKFQKLTSEKLKKNGNFEIPDYYNIVEVVGRGAYGVVVAAEDKRT